VIFKPSFSISPLRFLLGLTADKNLKQENKTSVRVVRLFLDTGRALLELTANVSRTRFFLIFM
jgi:hypothetical protein